MKILVMVFLSIFVPVVSLAEIRPFSLGLILPLTGPGAVWGQHLRQGAELANSKFSSVKLVFEDDHLDAGAAVSAYRKLTSGNKIDAVVLFGAQSARAVVPLAERDKVLSLVITTDSQSVVNTNYAVRLALDARPQAEALSHYLATKKVERVALVGTTQDAMLEYLTSFGESARQHGIEVIFNENYSKGETDFRTQIDRILTIQPQAVVSSLLPPSFSTFSKQLRQRNPTLRLIGFAQSENLAEVKAAEGSLENLVFSSVTLAPSFVEEYRSKFGEEPQSYACYTYDFVNMIAGLDPTKLESNSQHIRALKDFKGSCGTYSAKADFGFSLSPRLVAIRDGIFRDVDQNR